MKKIKAIGVIVITMTFSISFTQCTENVSADQLNSQELELTKSDSLTAQLTEDEINGILFLREEEKLARDVYLYLNDIHPLRPFQNISKSEQAHMDAIKYLIDTYELTDPVADNPEGVFQNEVLQNLYNELIEAGSASKVEALKVGALIEEIDILDLQHELDNTVENKDVIRVYQNLLSGSENHIRAFVRVLGFNGIDYVPIKLEQELFDAILAD